MMNNENPKFEMHQQVIQKFHGIGMIDQRQIRSDGECYYHVVFNAGGAAWVPERDLREVHKEAVR